ncbi:MAG TPA: endonuclease [Flavobacteriales bacterium]|nr:endonuclease [Flavobacteriales bacterium]
MKYSVRSYFGILLALTFALSSCKKDEITARDISVLNYNIAGLPQVLSSSNPELYTSHISRLLNEYCIVHVQEDFCYHDSLLLFDNHPYRTESTGCVPDGDGVNTLSCFPISNVERFAWEDCTGPDCLTPKGFYYSQIEVLPGKTIDFYNVHCNAGGSAESLAARRGNIKQVCNHIAQHSEGQAIIIMGDFNSRYTRDGDSVQAFFNFGLKDLWVELVRNGDVPDLNPEPLKDCDSRTSASCERVDKIFYRSSDDILITPTLFQVDDERFYYEGNDTLPLSDHWPMFANFTVELK